MKTKNLIVIAMSLLVLSGAAFGQTTVLVNDPAAESEKAEAAAVTPTKIELPATEQSLFDKSILPKVREKLAGGVCEETIEISGRLEGAFTRAGASQSLIFYQFCQTGNGLGSVGIAVIENGKVVANFYCADTGWTLDAKVLPDIDQNGLNEFALYYSGGMHQGAGGTGVEIMQFSEGGLNGIGWFQAEEFGETGPVMGYRVTVKPGKSPTFYKEKFVQNAAGKWRKSGSIVPLKLDPVRSKFESAK